MIKTNDEKLKALLADHIRRQRDLLLTDCDWTMAPDAPTDKDIWSQYRQALSDLTEQGEFPVEISWPTPPEQ